MKTISDDLLAPHTSRPRDVPRCGALSSLQKSLHYRGIQQKSLLRRTRNCGTRWLRRELGGGGGGGRRRELPGCWSSRAQSSFWICLDLRAQFRIYRVDSFQTRSAAWVPTLGY